jgi:Ser/Thr protein kinase RdoA (MazF antagonist)
VIVDAVRAANHIAGRFHWGTAVSMTPAAEGAMGQVWRLETEAASYAVKELYWAEDPVAEEATAVRQIMFCERARAAGVAAPANLRADSGQHVIALPQELGGGLIRAYEWIEGQPVTSADAGIAAWAGRTQAVIEALGALPGDQEVDPWSYRAPSKDTWDALADRCEQAQKPWTDQLREVLPRFVALTAMTGPPDPADLFVTHTDFQPQNVLVDGEGRFVLLDWDDAGPSTPARALGQLINNWHIHGSTVDHDGLRQTMAGYRAAGGTATITDVSVFGESVCGYLNYVHAQCELSLDRSQDAELQRKADHQVPDLLHPPQSATYEEAFRAMTAH